MLGPRVHLDNNATTRPLPEVREAVAAAMEVWGNPSSPHATGREAARLLSESRSAVAALLDARPAEVVFTSGGTEADRLGVLGALCGSGARRHVVASAIEHSAIHSLLLRGHDVTWVRPDEEGRVSAASVEQALRPDTALVALMWASNETGVIQPVEEVARLCAARGVATLVDAVQAAGKLEVSFRRLGVDLLAVSAHKLHGPKGIGALVVREGCSFRPPFPATQERGRRAGTEPVPLCAGFAAAARAAAAVTRQEHAATGVLRDRLERVLTGALDGVRRNGAGDRVSNTSNLSFDGVEAERLVAMLDRAGIDVGAGSACSSASPEPSHVLLAMGRSRREALSAIRFSLSRFTTREEIDRAAATTVEAVETLRHASPSRARRR